MTIFFMSGCILYLIRFSGAIKPLDTYQNLNEFGQMIRMTIAFSRFCPNLVHDETMQKESAFKVHYFYVEKDHNIKPHTI